MKKTLVLTVVTILLALSTAWAAPKIEIILTAEVDLKEVVDGKEVIKRVPAAEAGPGQTIFYTLSYRNNGDANATNVNLNDPIPKETMYVAGSAFGEGTTITFSTDGGQTYQEETRVTYKVKNADGSMSEKTASPDQYTNIRWTVQTVPAGFGGIVGFEAMVR